MWTKNDVQNKKEQWPHENHTDVFPFCSAKCGILTDFGLYQIVNNTDESAIKHTTFGKVDIKRCEKSYPNI